VFDSLCNNFYDFEEFLPFVSFLWGGISLPLCSTGSSLQLQELQHHIVSDILSITSISAICSMIPKHHYL
jgi:hypothetical protein